MKIEIGKTYEVSPQYKKSLIEIEQYTADSDKFKGVNVETLWRTGSFSVTPKNEEEVEWLQGAVDGDIWDYDDYEEVEMYDTYDGISEDLVFWGSGWEEGEQEDLEERYENQDDDDWCSYYEFLEERNGFTSQFCNWQIHNGVVVEEVEDEG